MSSGKSCKYIQYIIKSIHIFYFINLQMILSLENASETCVENILKWDFIWDRLGLLL